MALFSAEMRHQSSQTRLESVCRVSERDLTSEKHGDDFVSVGEVIMFEHVSEQMKEIFVVKSANIISFVPGYERQEHFI